MKDYCSKFIELCMQQCQGDELLDKKKRQKHNRAMDKRRKLQKEIVEAGGEAGICDLLYHQDPRVQLAAAAFCHEIDRCPDEVLQVLTYLKDNALDWVTRIDARVMFNLYTGILKYTNTALTEK